MHFQGRRLYFFFFFFFFFFFCFPSEKGSTVKRKNLHLEQILSFYSRSLAKGDPCPKGHSLQESKQEVTKVDSLVKMADNNPHISSLPKHKTSMKIK